MNEHFQMVHALGPGVLHYESGFVLKGPRADPSSQVLIMIGLNTL